MSRTDTIAAATAERKANVANPTSFTFDPDQYTARRQRLQEAINNVTPDMWLAYINHTVMVQITDFYDESTFTTVNNLTTKSLEEALSDGEIVRAIDCHTVMVKIIEGKIEDANAPEYLPIRKPYMTFTTSKGYEDFANSARFLNQSIIDATSKSLEDSKGINLLLTVTGYRSEKGKTYPNFKFSLAE